METESNDASAPLIDPDIIPGLKYSGWTMDDYKELELS